MMCEHDEPFYLLVGIEVRLIPGSGIKVINENYLLLRMARFFTFLIIDEYN